MPEISRFYGIIIRMYYREHGVPHFHAVYGAEEAVVAIDDGFVLAGRLGTRPLAMVREWADLHRQELNDAWEKARNQELPGRIDPLK